MNDQSLLPGRLGDDNRRFETDPRSDPRISEQVRLLGGFGAGLEPLPATATYQQCLDYCLAFEQIQADGHAGLAAIIPNLMVLRQVSRRSLPLRVIPSGSIFTDPKIVLTNCQD